jgi:23S rRNA (uracil1939-C5)-methyltransferase
MIELLCKHFGECGGCLHQDVPYEEQVLRKSEHLGQLFHGFWDEPIPVTPSPVVWHYRNKVDLSFARKWYETPPPKGFERESVLGFKTRGRWYRPLEVEECLIGPEDLTPLLESVRNWMQASGLHAFDSRTHQGFLKILLVREGKRTGQRMVVLTTADGDFDKPSFVRAVLDAYPADCIHRGIFRGFADVAAADEVELLHGPGTIEEQLHVPTEQGIRPLRFQISPFSFFQTNTLATELLYGGIRRLVAKMAGGMIYDLYGGAGGIALACADLAEKIHSVESVASATEDGLRNIELNGVRNITFETAKVEDYLKTAPEMHDALVVADPSRAGLHPKALSRLVELAPAQIIYVSCNPKIFAGELAAFLDTYRISHMEGYDLFPHTPHVELVALLERK